MNYISCNMREFIRDTKDKQILCFGGGSYFQVLCCDMSEIYPDMKLAGVIDNDVNKCGKIVTSAKFTAEILTPEKALTKFDFTKTVLVITTAQLNAVKKQLENIEKLADANVYSYFDLKKNSMVSLDVLHKNTAEPLIPKVIHYCWFGGKEMPERLRKCIASWERYCSDYEIKMWDENNYSMNEKMEEAYKMKMWARIADYARIDIIYNEGGIYFDTDVEIIRNIDILRYNEGFVATEITGGINSGSGFGAVKSHPVIERFKEIYAGHNSRFEQMSASNVGKETEFFFARGYQPNLKVQIIDGIAVYPYYIMAHKAFENGESFANDISLSLHYLDGSWR